MNFFELGERPEPVPPSLHCGKGKNCHKTVGVRCGLPGPPPVRNSRCYCQSRRAYLVFLFAAAAPTFGEGEGGGICKAVWAGSSPSGLQRAITPGPSAGPLGHVPTPSAPLPYPTSSHPALAMASQLSPHRGDTSWSEHAQTGWRETSDFCSAG